MKKQPEITALTRQNLIDAFWSLYCRKRIEKISIKEITTLAGYNRGTFYEYFSDVYDVLEQIEKSLLPEINELPPINIPSKEITLPVDAFIKTYEANRKYYVVLLGDNGDPSFQSKLKNTVKPMLKQAACAKGIENDFQLDYILEYTISAMIGILSYWFRQEDAPSVEKLISLMYDLMQNGVMTKLNFLC